MTKSTTKTQSQIFERMFREHQRAVLGYALRRLDAESARDVLAETFLIAWRRRLDIPVAELPWLLGVARNLTRQHYRAGARDRAVRTELARLEVLVADGLGDPGDAVLERISVLEALSGLSATDRETLMLTAWDGLSSKDAAKVSGCSHATFRVRLHRARTRLAGAFQDSNTDPGPRASGPKLQPVTGPVEKRVK